MNESTTKNEQTRALLLGQYRNYPRLQTEDIFKYIHQSTFGCEHLVSSEERALEFIKREFETLPAGGAPEAEPLDGDFCRVHLSYLNDGLSPETLARLFFLSAKETQRGADPTERLRIARELIESGEIPLSLGEFDAAWADWKAAGYPALHHSDAFREAYRPAYRVIANRYATILPLLSKIDGLLRRGSAVVALEGGSASGKTTLSGILSEVYDCNVFHMDDFFLRPEQRTALRLAEVGGNLDRERFYEEILRPLNARETVRYRPFDCSTQSLCEAVTVPQKRLTLVEGVYSLHPAFGEYYDLAVFLDVDPERQRERIRVRNAPMLAKRFFEEWIPMENRYFSELGIRSRCHIRLSVGE